MKEGRANYTFVEVLVLLALVTTLANVIIFAKEFGYTFGVGAPNTSCGIVERGTLKQIGLSLGMYRADFDSADTPLPPEGPPGPIETSSPAKPPGES